MVWTSPLNAALRLFLNIWQTESAATIGRLRHPLLVLGTARTPSVAFPVSPGDPVARRRHGYVQLQRKTVVRASAASTQVKHTPSCFGPKRDRL